MPRERWTLRPDLTDSSQREGDFIQMANKIGALIVILLLAGTAPASSATANKYCTGHRGICGCSGANDLCCDGAISSARCDPEDTPPWNRAMQCIEFVPAMKEMDPLIVDPAKTVGSPDCNHLVRPDDKCFCIDQAGVDARSGCCPHHGGACGCSRNSVTCCDGTSSPTCTCHDAAPKRSAD